MLHSQVGITSSEKAKVTFNLDDLSDRLSINVIASELQAEDHAADMPKIEHSANKIVGKRFLTISPMILEITTVSFYSLG